MLEMKDEIVTIESEPKVSSDLKTFTVKGVFPTKTPKWAGYQETVKIEGSYDLSIFQHLQPGSTIKVSGYYTPPHFKDSRGLLLATSIKPAIAPEQTMGDRLQAFDCMPSFNPYMVWRDSNLIDWMRIDRVVDEFLCKFPEHFELDSTSQPGQPWVELSKSLSAANKTYLANPERIWVAPQGLVDAAVGETVREALFEFAGSIGMNVIKVRPRPELQPVEFGR